MEKSILNWKDARTYIPHKYERALCVIADLSEEPYIDLCIWVEDAWYSYGRRCNIKPEFITHVAPDIAMPVDAVERFKEVKIAHGKEPRVWQQGIQDYI